MKIFFSSQFSSLKSFLAILDRENRYFLTKIQKVRDYAYPRVVRFFQNAFAALILYIFVKNSFNGISNRFRIELKKNRGFLQRKKKLSKNYRFFDFRGCFDNPMV